MEFFGDYNFDAFKMYERVLSDYLEKQEDLKRLEEAQKNNFEFMELSGQVSKLKQDIEDVIREQDIIRDNMSKTKTEYDINKIKAMHEADFSGDEKLYVYGAMELYLDFINIFLRILSIMGKRKN